MWTAVYQSRRNHVQARCTSFLYFPGNSYHSTHRAPAMLSLAGPVMACRAIASAIVSGKTVRLERDGEEPVHLQKEGHQEFRILSATLRKGIHHVLVVDSRAFPSVDSMKAWKEILVIASPGQTTTEVVFNVLKRSFSTPLLPQWADELPDMLKENVKVEDLEGNHPGPALFLSMSDAYLDRLVSRGVEEGRLTF